MIRKEIQKLLKSKRAEELPTEPDYVLYFMISASIIGLFAVFLVIATSSYQSSTTTVLGNLKYTIVQYRLLHSPECFAHLDSDTKRAYPMVINLTKFTNERLSGCMKGMITNNLCVDMELKEPAGRQIAEIKTTNYGSPEKVTVDNWVVNVLDKGRIYTAMLTVKQGDPC